MKILTWQNPEQLVVAQYIINNVKLKCCAIKVDNLVYHLYGLTYDEVKIVVPETPITEEEYDA